MNVGDAISNRISFLATKKSLKSVSVNQEESINAPAISFIPRIVSLNELIQGSSQFQRVGIQASFKNIQIVFRCMYTGSQFTYTAPNNTSYNPIWKSYQNQVRILVVWDTQPKLTLPTIAEIIQDIDQNGLVNPGFTSAVDNTIISHPDTPWISASQNRSNRRRFIFIRDAFITLSDPTPALNNPEGNVNAIGGQGPSPNTYKRRYSIHLDRELERKGIQIENTTYNYHQNLPLSTEIATGQLLAILYFQKTNITYEIDCTSWYDDNQIRK